MSIDRKCPKCGSHKVQLTNKRSKHGILWLILFGWITVLWWCVKVTVAMMIVMVEWIPALIAKIRGKGYTWHARKWISFSKKLYYCHDCGYNWQE